MLKQCGLIVGIVAFFCVPAIGGTDYYFGNFESDVLFNGQYITNGAAGQAGGYRGWFDWTFDSDPLITSASPSTQFGVTTGTNSIAWQPTGTGFHQGLAVKIQDLPAATRGGFFDAFFSNTHIAMNVTWNNDEWFDRYSGSGWNGAEVSMAINYGPSGQYQGQGLPDIDTGNPGNQGRWDLNNYPGVHNRIVQWDYSALKPAIQALYNAGTLTETAGWLEIMLETNMGEFTAPVTFYIDSWRLTDNIDDTEPTGDFTNDGVVDAADYVMWRKNNMSAGDYTLWVNTFGDTIPGGGGGANTGGVPEPAAAAIVVALSCMLSAVRRRA